MRVLTVSGSLRSSSLNSELLRLAATLAPDDVEVVGWEGLGAIPPYDQDEEDRVPEAVAAFAEAVRSADAVLFATPEYNASIPGQLKNALDWVSRPDIMSGPFWGRQAAVVSASTGLFGGIWAQQDLKRVLKSLGARVVDAPDLALARAHERLAAPDAELRAAIASVWDSFAEAVAVAA